jgi:hypothetical protein
MRKCEVIFSQALSPEFSHYLFEHPELEEKIPILFPMHPKTRKHVRIFCMESAFDYHPLT